MSNYQINFNKIRNKAIISISFQYLPLFIFGLLEPLLENATDLENIIFLFAVFAFLAFCIGYGICTNIIDKYATYKGYENPLFIYSILNIFGLAILFLLPNKNKTSDQENKDPLDRFSITAIFVSYLAITLLIISGLFIGAGFIIGFEGLADLYKNNKDFATFSELVTAIALAWYFFKQLTIANIDRKRILGSLKNINFKLPIGLAVIKYLFAWGINPITLYGLSFILPQYVEAQLNYKYATTPISWIFLAISALIYAPVIEELFFRGIIFQKLAIKKGMIYGLSISAILFTVIHFRYDVISLFLSGIIAALIYFKTKQLTTPIIYHFTYNLIVVIRRLFYQLFSTTDPSVKTTIIEYQQNFRNNWELHILLVAISTPYLIYFIYKNFPRNFTTTKLPYFINQERLSEITY